MKSQLMKTTSIAAALLMTLVIGAPAVADDTELLVVDPTKGSIATPPNIMFILDTSGSMGDPVDTTDPFDPAKDYSAIGDCDKDRFYWTTLDVPPTCEDVDGNENPQFFTDAAFVCEDADLRMMGMGAYSGVLVQYRTDGTGSAKWQPLQSGNNGSPVECQKDSGVHGDGATGIYAKAGTDAGLFTNDPDEEIAWGSSDASQTYTVYDGNYLNWRDNPEIVSMAKMDILKAVTRNLMNSIEDVNVGMMRFNDSEGGRVLHDISDLNTERAAILTKLKNLPTGGRTPLAESLYEAARYWRGLSADYGDFTTTTVTDPMTGVDIVTPNPADIDVRAFVAGAPGDYQQPVMPSCTRNYNVLLTDGEPVNDDGAQTEAPKLPSWGLVNGATCDGTGQGRCLDDIGRYLKKVDITPGNPGDFQTVTTHTIGFAIDLDILVDTAAESEGKYFKADNTEELTNALMRIVEIALDKGLSFTAPSVAVNTFNRTQNFNELYISTFLPKPNVHWPGNLKKYSIAGGVIMDAQSPSQPAVNPDSGFFYDDSFSFWAGVEDGSDVALGGAASQLPDPDLRNVYTNYGTDNDLWAGSNAIDTSNTVLQLSDFGLSGAPGEPTLEDLIDWSRGEDILDVDNNATTTVRYVMGDPLHSQPAAIVYGGTSSDPDTVIFTATNDGYLHAIDGKTGVELWSFIPKQLLPDLPELMLDGLSTYKHYGIDGDVVPVVADLDNDGIINNDDFVHIIFGMRRGGNDYFSIDVTDRDKPTLLWHKTFPEFGQSWSRPVVARVDMDTSSSTNKFSTDNDLKAVVILGEGYDTVHDSAALPATPDNVGAGISMLDLFTGERLWRAGRSNADLTLSRMNRSIPSQVRAVDFTGDGFIDRMYAVDVSGQIFRFDVFRNETPADTVTGGVIAHFGGDISANAGDTDTRRFYSAPDISIFSDPVLNRRFLAIGVGSGYRAHPLDLSADDKYFSLRDPNIFAKLTNSDYPDSNVATVSDMVEISGQLNTQIGSTDRGWMFTVPTGQMILSSSATFDNSVFFISYQPDLSALSACEVAPGKNFLYRVNVANGDPIANNLDTMDPNDSNEARVTALEQGGIAPTPAFLFPGSDDTCNDASCVQPPIGCVGVECFDPGFDNIPVRTLWTQDGIE